MRVRYARVRIARDEVVRVVLLGHGGNHRRHPTVLVIVIVVKVSSRFEEVVPCVVHEVRLVGVDAGGDGLPDDVWRRSDIIDWIRANGGTVGRVYQTKTQLLAQVDTILNPPAPEPVVEETVEEPVAEEVVEEVVADEATETETMEE